MEAVHEFEGERDQESDEEQEVRQETRDPRAGGVDIGVDAVGNEQQPGCNDAQIDNAGQWMKTAIEVRALFQCWLYRTG